MVVELIREPDFQAFIRGIPRPQGSKVVFRNGGMRESSIYLKEWRRTMTLAAVHIHNNRPPLDGPLAIGLEFVLARPKALSARKPTPPAAKRPDWDKLSRAVCDALTDARVYRDDSQIVSARVDKRIAQPGEDPGVAIVLWQGGIHIA